MLLAIDIGNTNIKFAVFDGSINNMLCNFAVSSQTFRTSCEYELLIKQLLLNNSIDILPTDAVISSVVPSLTQPVADAARAICSSEPFMIGTGTRTGFKIRIDVQSQLGADIVSNTAAAFTYTEPPFIIVDTGTATTLTAVDTNGQLIGTVIAPGAHISLEALNSSAALLTDVSLLQPDHILGKNSQDSIRSGAYWGHVYMIDGFVHNLRRQLCPNDEKLGLISTGGLSELLFKNCQENFTYIPNLTLKGAAALYYHNLSLRKR